MQQYWKIKSQYPEEIVFFRMGDFYEMFGEDAKSASQILGIALTSRAHGDMEKIPLAGVPYHAADRYLAKLIAAGKKVVVCEQMEDPKLARGLVKRDVVEIITPGTVLLANAGAGERSTYLVSLYPSSDGFGLAQLEVSTGEFRVEEGKPERINELLSVLAPAEILLPSSAKEHQITRNHFPWQPQFSYLDDWKFAFDFAYRSLTEHFGTQSLAGFGCDGLKVGISAAGATIVYLKETKKTVLSHIRSLSRIGSQSEMFLDFATVRNLELVSSLGSDERKYSLFGVLNRTRTAMGARLLRQWLLAPLIEVEPIQKRQKAVARLVKDADLRGDIQNLLSRASDLERLAGRLGASKASPKDLIGIKETCALLPTFQKLLADEKVSLLAELNQELPDVSDVVDLISRSVVDEPPVVTNEGGLIKSGYDGKLDSLKDSIRGSKTWIANLQAIERERTGIPSLKVGFNKVFGYYLEVTTPHVAKVPPDYIRKQTLVNGERYITPELKEKEELILNAEEKINRLEQELFLVICQRVAQRIGDLQRAASVLAQLDVLASLAQVGWENGYCLPEVNTEGQIEITEGRHPIIEKVLPKGSFVPNDTQIDLEHGIIQIITGPNMAGKSTYLRQVGLIVLLSQIGSFVPAEKARIGICDRIFTRVGAADDLIGGRSTFLVEMNETANILNNATPKSLILLDEIGRGTSTYDGLSIAWAVAEYLHDSPKLGARTLFATHYHELTELASILPKVKNYQVAVKESKTLSSTLSEAEGSEVEGWQDQIIFLRKIVPGGCDDSFGIQVAKLSGIPEAVLTRAKEVLDSLEKEESVPKKNEKRKLVLKAPQPTLFEKTDPGVYD